MIISQIKRIKLNKKLNNKKYKINYHWHTKKIINNMLKYKN